MNLIVDPSGRIACLYTEAINLNTLGDLSIRRASFVEPDADGQWWADLEPVRGPNLGPFLRRSDALQAECNWLEDRLPILLSASQS